MELPGLQVSKMYSLFVSPVVAFGSSGMESCSKPVPPFGRRTKRLVMGEVRCEPGRNDKAPLEAVHCSRAIQKPSAVRGFVY